MGEEGPDKVCVSAASRPVLFSLFSFLEMSLVMSFGFSRILFAFYSHLLTMVVSNDTFSFGIE